MAPLAGSLADERRAWIALASAPGVGEMTFERILAVYGGARPALDAVARLGPASADRRLASRLGMRLSTGLAQALREAAEDPEATERRVAALGGWALTPFDPHYPARLAEIEDPPPVLYGLGERLAPSRPPLVAVVGTRRPTGLGRDLAARVARRLGELGVTVVSGLAVGIDGVAHEAAIEGGTLTVAVSGSGLSEPAPRANRRLASAILETGGAIVSELAPDARPSVGTFPRRNRIISAMTSATVVIEAPARSGALITARLALEQGRRLLVAPGRPLDGSVAGCLALLRETPARPLVGLDELPEDLGLGETWPRPGRDQASGPGPAHDRTPAALSPSAREVAALLATAPHTVDSLAAATGLSAREVAAALTLLQVRGWARSHGSLQLPAGPLLSVEPGPVAAPRTP